MVVLILESAELYRHVETNLYIKCFLKMRLSYLIVNFYDKFMLLITLSRKILIMATKYSFVEACA